MKIVDATIWAGAAILCMFGALVAFDLLSAIGAQACHGGPDCYPWAAEGPAADYWRYSSKSTYLATGASMVVLPLAVAALMIGSRYDRSAFIRVMALSGLGAAVLLYLA